MKFLECEIKTKQVYLNILREDLVETKILSANKALSEYGLLTVVSVDKPEVEDTFAEESQLSKSPRKQMRANGITNIVLQ